MTDWLRCEGRPFVFGDGKQWTTAAEAGIFAFDHDRHLGGYKLHARPAAPIHHSALTAAVARAATLTNFATARFATMPLVTASDLEAEDE